MALSTETNGYKKHGNGNLANQGGKWISPKKRRAIYIRDDLRCIYCQAGIEDAVIFTLDHLQPQELGGDNRAANLVTCCKACNSAKGRRTLKQFLQYLADRGQDAGTIQRRIRRNTRRKLHGLARYK